MSEDRSSCTPGGAPTPAQSPRRQRSALLILAIAFASLVVVGGAVGVVIYAKATEIDRSTPTVAVRQFLQAALLDKDIDRIALFVCREWPPPDAIREAASDVGPTVKISWGVTSEQVNGPDAEVVARVTFSVTDGGTAQRSVEVWRLRVVQEDGWRVCSLQRDESLNP